MKGLVLLWGDKAVIILEQAASTPGGQAEAWRLCGPTRVPGVCREGWPTYTDRSGHSALPCVGEREFATEIGCPELWKT